MQPTIYPQRFQQLPRPDLLSAGIFPHWKVVTEMMGAENAVKQHLPDFHLYDPGISMLAVADGRAPRMGSIFCVQSAWQCYSIDPTMEDNPVWHNARNLFPHRMTIEEFGKRKGAWRYAPKLLVLAVHSHASLEDICEAIGDHPYVGIVAVECCIPLRLSTALVTEYKDTNMWTDSNHVRVYRGAISNGSFAERKAA